MLKLKPKDIVAIVFLLLVFAFKWFKSETSFDSTLALVVGYYFAHRMTGSDIGH